jgi:hypothetical protein
LLLQQQQQQQPVTSQGLSNSLWAVARLGWGPAALQQDGSSSSSSGDDGSSSSSSNSWLGCFLHWSLDALDSFSDQGLTNCCWALGRITQQQQQQQQRRQQQQQQQQQTVSDLLVSSGWLDRVLIVLQPRLLGLSGQQLSNAIWGLARSGAPVPRAWLDTFVR